MPDDLRHKNRDKLVETIQDYQELITNIETIIDATPTKTAELLAIRELIVTYVHQPQRKEKPWNLGRS